jgi:hypothetical protein
MNKIQTQALFEMLFGKRSEQSQISTNNFTEPQPHDLTSSTRLFPMPCRHVAFHSYRVFGEKWESVEIVSKNTFQ